MEVKIKTSTLQEMVGKAIKCVSNNKLIPLTSLMSVKVESNYFMVSTTNGTIYFYATSPDKVDSEDFEVCVMADTFTKLIQKTTSDDVTLEVVGNVLQVKGNGTYKLELTLDENGNPAKFPNKIGAGFREKVGEIKVSTVKNVILANKPSLAVNMDYPALTCYYCGKQVITSNRKQICRYDIPMFDNALLITPTLMELLASVSGETIEVEKDQNSIVYTTDVDGIFSPITEGIETFPVEQINKLVDQDFTSNCKVSRSAILNIIDRLALFVASYDKSAIYLTFTNEGIMLSSKRSSGEELIPYISSIGFAPYTCCINIEMLRSQIATSDEEELNLFYGSNVAVKLQDKNVTQIVALLEDDRMEA